jgi:hypothetical protein
MELGAKSEKKRGKLRRLQCCSGPEKREVNSKQREDPSSVIAARKLAEKYRGLDKKSGFREKACG